MHKILDIGAVVLVSLVTVLILLVVDRMTDTGVYQPIWALVVISAVGLAIVLRYRRRTGESGVEPRNTFMRWALLFIILAVWAVQSAMSNYFRGDEYLMFALASLPGIWVLMWPNNMNGQLWAILAPAAGILPVIAAGYLLLNSRVPARAFIVTYVIGFFICLLGLMLPYIPGGRVIAKHGSLLAYYFAAANFALVAHFPAILAARFLASNRRVFVRDSG